MLSTGVGGTLDQHEARLVGRNGNCSDPSAAEFGDAADE